MIRRKVKLKKELGVWSLAILGITMIIGAGIFALIGEGVKLAGSSIMISLILTALIAFFSALSYAELSSIFPRASSSYIYVRKSFNSKFLSFLVGWCILCVFILGTSVISVAFANYLGHLIPLHFLIPSVVIILVFSLIALRGIKESARMIAILGVIEISTLVIFIIVGLSFGDFSRLGGISINFSTLSVAGLLFFAFLGFEAMATCAEETKHANKIVPKAIILAFIICTLIYILVAIALLSLIPLQEIGTAPIAEGVVQYLGKNFSFLIAIGSLIAIGDGILVFLISGSRFVYGLSSEGVLPKVFSRVNEKFRTPHIAILLVALLSIGFCFFGRNLNLIANATNFAALFAFFFVNLSVIMLRIKNPDAERGFKIPISIKNIPITSLLGVMTSFALICSLGFTGLGLGLGLLVIGIICYFLVGRVRFKYL